MQALAQAQPNIALVKYWGKRDARLNLPATGSLSITLESLWTRTRVVVEDSLEADTLSFDGRPARAAQTERVRRLLDDLRGRAGSRACARVETTNSFRRVRASRLPLPFRCARRRGERGLRPHPRRRRALAHRPDRLRVGRTLDLRRLSSRCIGASPPDGRDAHASPLLAAEAWPLEVVIADHERR
jgi:diphosphomevalonate decarboxylase